MRLNLETAITLGAGPPGRYIWVTPSPGFAYPSGELQPGLLHEQALRAVCQSVICCAEYAEAGLANKRCVNSPEGLFM